MRLLRLSQRQHLLPPTADLQYRDPGWRWTNDYDDHNGSTACMRRRCDTVRD